MRVRQTCQRGLQQRCTNEWVVDGDTLVDTLAEGTSFFEGTSLFDCRGNILVREDAALRPVDCRGNILVRIEGRDGIPIPPHATHTSSRIASRMLTRLLSLVAQETMVESGVGGGGGNIQHRSQTAAWNRSNSCHLRSNVARNAATHDEAVWEGLSTRRRNDSFFRSLWSLFRSTSLSHLLNR